MNLSSFTELVKRAKAIAIFCHHNADPDALGSSYGVRWICSNLAPSARADIIAVGGASSLSLQLLSELNIAISFLEECSPTDYDLFFMVDTNSFTQLSPYDEEIFSSTTPLIVIDHHAVKEEVKTRTSFSFIDPNATSTAELVFSLMESLPLPPPPMEVSLLLLAGIVFDTRRFAIASAKTFSVVAKLVDLGANYNLVLKALQTKVSYSERVARLKAAQRTQLYLVNDDLVVAVSHVGSYEASAARSLLEIGADAAFVVSEKDDAVRVSARCNSHFAEKTGMHLGVDVMEPLGKLIGGAGGGHSMAAGADGTGSAEYVISLLVELLRKKFSEKGLSFKPLK